MNNFSQSASQGLRLSKLSIGLDFNEPSTSNWRTSTGVYFKVSVEKKKINTNIVKMRHIKPNDFFLLLLKWLILWTEDNNHGGRNDILVRSFVQNIRFIHDSGRSISRDLDGFPVTCRWMKFIWFNIPIETIT
jgi:hypothetical protein